MYNADDVTEQMNEIANELMDGSTSIISSLFAEEKDFTAKSVDACLAIMQDIAKLTESFKAKYEELKGAAEGAHDVFAASGFLSTGVEASTEMIIGALTSFIKTGAEIRKDFSEVTVRELAVEVLEMRRGEVPSSPLTPEHDKNRDEWGF